MKFQHKLYFVIAFLFRLSHAIVLEGSSDSFVRYPKWYHAFENTFTFEFRTKTQNGLLMYTDDGRLYNNFFEFAVYNARFVHKRAQRCNNSIHLKAPSAL